MLNLSKPDSLFNEGMKVLIYSEKLSEDKDIGWQRGGTKISYYQNGIKKEKIVGLEASFIKMTAIRPLLF